MPKDLTKEQQGLIEKISALIERMNSLIREIDKSKKFTALEEKEFELFAEYFNNMNQETYRKAANIFDVLTKHVGNNSQREIGLINELCNEFKAIEELRLAIKKQKQHADPKTQKVLDGILSGIAKVFQNILQFFAKPTASALQTARSALSQVGEELKKLPSLFKLSRLSKKQKPTTYYQQPKQRLGIKEKEEARFAVLQRPHDPSKDI